MLTPSITAKKMATPMPEFRAALHPPRIARALPVKKPAMTTDTITSYLALVRPSPLTLWSNPLTCVVRVLFLPDPLDSAIKRGEETPKDGKVSAQDGCSGLDGR